ncbi:MAG: transglycosylase, partial [bacterium]
MHTSSIFPFALALVAGLTFTFSPALAPPAAAQPQVPAQVLQQDDEVRAAREAFRLGQAARLDQAAARLRGHPLEPWVQYWQLRLRLETAETAEVQSALARLADTRAGDQLRADWLKLLGRRGQWDLFAAEHPRLVNSDTEIDCHALTHRRTTGDAAALAEARPIWFTGRDLPESCTPLFQDLIASGSLRADDIWARIRLTLEAGQVGTVRRVAAFLPAGQQPDGKAIDFALNNPQAVLDRRNELRTRAQREVVMFAAHRLARTSPQNAAQAWGRIDEQFSEAERAYTWGAIAWLGARRLDPDALRWFRMSNGVQLNDEMLGWRVRAALRAEAWPEVLAAIGQMSAREQQDAAWRYWRARALR